MKIQSLFLIAVAATLASGCAVTKGGTTYSVESVYPLDGTPLSPRTPPVHGVPCQSGPECTINIKVVDDNCNVALDQYVQLAAANHFVTWKLLTAPYKFCQGAGDGMFLKDPNLPSPFQPWQNPACVDMFKVTRQSIDGKDYEYKLVFRAGSKICVVDPWMRN
jgi:hypothetical protein